MKEIGAAVRLIFCFLILGVALLSASWLGTEDFYFSYLEAGRWSDTEIQSGEGTLSPSGGRLVFNPGSTGSTHVSVLPWAASLPTQEDWYLEADLCTSGTLTDGASLYTGVAIGLNAVPSLSGTGIFIRLENEQSSGTLTRKLVFETRSGDELFSHYAQNLTVEGSSLSIKLQFMQSANMFIFCYEQSPDIWVCVAATPSKITLGDNDVLRACLTASANLPEPLSESIWLDDFFLYQDDQDKDSDGLNKEQEQEIGTSPNNPDSDHDGLTDSEEVNVYNTNPSSVDSDGDLIPDGQEISGGSNPADSASIPSLLETEFSDGGASRSIYILTFPGLTYQLQQSSDLKTWTNLDAAIEGTGESQTVSLTGSQDANRFYRLQVSD